MLSPSPISLRRLKSVLFFSFYAVYIKHKKDEHFHFSYIQNKIVQPFKCNCKSKMLLKINPKKFTFFIEKCYYTRKSLKNQISLYYNMHVCIYMPIYIYILTHTVIKVYHKLFIDKIKLKLIYKNSK